MPETVPQELRLFYLAASGNVDGVKEVLRSGVSVDATDYNGRSPLHIAADRGHCEVVECLIAQGANVNSKDEEGETPWALAANRRHSAVMTMLQRAGARSCDENMHTAKAKRYMHASFAVMEAFPRPIAMALLEGRKVASITKDNVSVLFSDIVGFTEMSSTMDAAKVSNLLNRLFRKFDALAYLHGVQKIDVIGDAYMAATNFSEDQRGDHAARIARFAVDCILSASETPLDEDRVEQLGCVRVRIGIHSGPVSGSVVGSHSVKYTLMGDTVNTASRMESTGAAGRIQCSEATAALLRAQADEMLVRPRGAGGVRVKGKGCMQTWWVWSLRRAVRNFGSCPDLQQLQRQRAPRPQRSDRNLYRRAPLDWHAGVAGGGGGGGSCGSADERDAPSGPSADAWPRTPTSGSCAAADEAASAAAGCGRSDSEGSCPSLQDAAAAPRDVWGAGGAGGGSERRRPHVGLARGAPPRGDCAPAAGGHTIEVQ